MRHERTNEREEDRKGEWKKYDEEWVWKREKESMTMILFSCLSCACLVCEWPSVCTRPTARVSTCFLSVLWVYCAISLPVSKNSLHKQSTDTRHRPTSNIQIRRKKIEQTGMALWQLGYHSFVCVGRSALPGWVRRAVGMTWSSDREVERKRGRENCVRSGVVSYYVPLS